MFPFRKLESTRRPRYLTQFVWQILVSFMVTLEALCLRSVNITFSTSHSSILDRCSWSTSFVVCKIRRVASRAVSSASVNTLLPDWVGMSVAYNVHKIASLLVSRLSSASRFQVVIHSRSCPGLNPFTTRYLRSDQINNTSSSLSRGKWSTNLCKSTSTLV